MTDNVYASCCIAAKISSIKDIITALSAIGAIIIAGIGLYTWKRQLKGTSKYDVARNLLKSVYNVQHAIEALRSRKMTVRREEVGPGDNIRDALIKTTEKVYQSRWDFVNNLMIVFEDKQIDAEVLLDKNIIAIGDKFRKCVRDLEVDLRIYLQMHSMKDFYTDPTYKKVSSTVMSSVQGEKDEFNETITDIVKDYQKELSRYL